MRNACYQYTSGLSFCWSTGRKTSSYLLTLSFCYHQQKGKGETDVNKLFSHVGAAVTKWVTVLWDRWKLCSGDVELLLQLMFV